MSWVCTNCSTSNKDHETSCGVCGVRRATATAVSTAETEECKVVFTNTEAFVESVRGFFARRKKPRVKPPKAKKTAPAAVTKAPKPKRTVTATPAEPVEEKPKKPVTGGLAPAWPEHKIRFDPAVIGAKGFVSSERETMNGVNGYRFYKADGSSQFIRAEMAIVQRMAQKV